jgi:hypothetical protein
MTHLKIIFTKFDLQYRSLEIQSNIIYNKNYKQGRNPYFVSVKTFTLNFRLLIFKFSAIRNEKLIRTNGF